MTIKQAHSIAKSRGFPIMIKFGEVHNYSLVSLSLVSVKITISNITYDDVMLLEDIKIISNLKKLSYKRYKVLFLNGRQLRKIPSMKLILICRKNRITTHNQSSS